MDCTRWCRSPTPDAPRDLPCITPPSAQCQECTPGTSCRQARPRPHVGGRVRRADAAGPARLRLERLLLRPFRRSHEFGQLLSLAGPARRPARTAETMPASTSPLVDRQHSHEEYPRRPSLLAVRAGRALEHSPIHDRFNYERKRENIDARFGALLNRLAALRPGALPGPRLSRSATGRWTRC